MKRGFTLVELLVVVGMIAILGGAMVTSISNAQRRAKLSKANVDVGEMTKAILAYANYTDEGTLESVANLNDAPAQASALAFILGGVQGRGGSNVPVLYNGAVKNGYIVDPWGNPYRVTIKVGEEVKPGGVPDMSLKLFYPNWHRLSGGER
jgi:prepilin-type N-terminal cleavage/methylation domain-containing protein